jgi:lipopolysaccharide export LptBFGC system permease protein LptF
MKLIQQKLLRELISNMLLTGAVLSGVFFVISLALILGAQRSEGLPFVLLVRHTGLNLLANLHLLLPLVTLTAALFTYARFREEGEATAMRVAGVSTWPLLAPALLFGAAASLGLTFLQDEIIPGAWQQSRAELTRDLLSHVEDILLGESAVSGSRFEAHWRGRSADARGRLVLERLEMVELDEQRRVSAHTLAAKALPRFDRMSGGLDLELEDVRRWTRAEGTASAGRLHLSLPLDELSQRESLPRKDAGRSTAELLALAASAEESARTAPLEERPELLRAARQARGKYGLRLGFAAAPLVCACFGAAFGLLRGRAHRLIVFLTGFGVVALVHYPLSMLSDWVFLRGHIDTSAIYALGDVVLLVATIVCYRRIEQ